MKALTWQGKRDVRVETVPVPQIGPGELLVRVHTCGICGTDLKKIATGSHSAPRIFGHETSGVVAAVAPWQRFGELAWDKISLDFAVNETDVNS